MKTLVGFFKWVSKLFPLLGLCATVGFIAGALAGGALLLFASIHPTVPTLSTSEVWQVALLLWAYTTLALLFFLYVFCRFTLASILLPTIVNCFLTCLLTVWLVDKFALWQWAFFIGAVVGILIGRLLCMCCHYFTVKPNGLYNPSPEVRSGR